MTSPAQQAGPRRVVVLATFSAFLVGLDSMITVPLIPAIAEDTGTPIRLGGLFVTTYALLFALASPLCGAMSDRLGRRRVLTTGLVLFALANVATGLGMSFWFLLVCRALAGLGGAMIMPSVYAMVSDTVAYERRGKVMGIVVAGLLSSTVLGVPLGSYLAHVASWRAAFVAVAAVAALTWLLVLLRLPATPPTATQQQTSPLAVYAGMLRRAVGTPALLCVLGATLLWACALYGMFSNIGIFYSERFGFSQFQTGLAIMGSGAGSMAGALLGGRIADRFGKRTVLVAAAVVAAAGVTAVPLFGESLGLVLASFVVWGTAVGVGQPCLSALVSELRPETRGTALALNGSAQYGGMMLSTAVAALLLDNGVSFVVIGALGGVCALAVLPLVLGVRSPVAPASTVAPEPATPSAQTEQ